MVNKAIYAIALTAALTSHQVFSQDVEGSGSCQACGSQPVIAVQDSPVSYESSIGPCSSCSPCGGASDSVALPPTTTGDASQVYGGCNQCGGQTSYAEYGQTYGTSNYSNGPSEMNVMLTTELVALREEVKRLRAATAQHETALQEASTLVDSHKSKIETLMADALSANKRAEAAEAQLRQTQASNQAAVAKMSKQLAVANQRVAQLTTENNKLSGQLKTFQDAQEKRRQEEEKKRRALEKAKRDEAEMKAKQEAEAKAKKDAEQAKAKKEAQAKAKKQANEKADMKSEAPAPPAPEADQAKKDAPADAKKSAEATDNKEEKAVESAEPQQSDK